MEEETVNTIIRPTIGSVEKTEETFSSSEDQLLLL